MRVKRTINCCGLSVNVDISNNNPYTCPHCGKTYTVENTSTFDPYLVDLEQYSYLFAFAVGIGILGICGVVTFFVYALIYL